MDSLADLASRYEAFPADYYVADSAGKPGLFFDSDASVALGPNQALDSLSKAGRRLLLKRPEKHDPRFRLLLDELLAKVGKLHEPADGFVRVESAIFISAAAAITPFHFDPETALFMQIAGDKEYHVFPPRVIEERNLEDFYAKGLVSVGPFDLERCDPAQEMVYQLRPGDGFYQPQNAPHWVRTKETLSISYSVVFETVKSRALGHTRAFNSYIRKMGVHPSTVGRRPLVDAIKAMPMPLVTRSRKRVTRFISHS